MAEDDLSYNLDEVVSYAGFVADHAEAAATATEDFDIEIPPEIVRDIRRLRSTADRLRQKAQEVLEALQAAAGGEG